MTLFTLKLNFISDSGLLGISDARLGIVSFMLIYVCGVFIPYDHSNFLSFKSFFSDISRSPLIM